MRIGEENSHFVSTPGFFSTASEVLLCHMFKMKSFSLSDMLHMFIVAQLCSQQQDCQAETSLIIVARNEREMSE